MIPKTWGCTLTSAKRKCTYKRILKIMFHERGHTYIHPQCGVVLSYETDHGRPYHHCLTSPVTPALTQLTRLHTVPTSNY